MVSDVGCGYVLYRNGSAHRPDLMPGSPGTWGLGRFCAKGEISTSSSWLIKGLHSSAQLKSYCLRDCVDQI